MSLDEYKTKWKECLMRKGLTSENADESIKKPRGYLSSRFRGEMESRGHGNNYRDEILTLGQGNRSYQMFYGFSEKG